MLTANFLKPAGFRADHLYEVLQGDAPITTLNETRFTFDHGEANYTILRKGGMFPNYVLARDDTPLASAAQAPFRNKYTVTVETGQWIFKAEGIMAQKFGLFENDTEIGTIAAGSPPKRLDGITVDLPDSIPVPIQLYLLLIVLRAWESQGS